MGGVGGGARESVASATPYFHRKLREFRKKLKSTGSTYDRSQTLTVDNSLLTISYSFNKSKSPPTRKDSFTYSLDVKNFIALSIESLELPQSASAPELR